MGSCQSIGDETLATVATRCSSTGVSADDSAVGGAGDLNNQGFGYCFGDLDSGADISGDGVDGGNLPDI